MPEWTADGTLLRCDGRLVRGCTDEDEAQRLASMMNAAELRSAVYAADEVDPEGVFGRHEADEDRQKGQ